MRRPITGSQNENAEKPCRSFFSCFLHFFLVCLALSFSGRIQFARGGDDSDDSKEKSSKHAEASKAPSFRDHIRPLLEAKCWRCHSGKTRRKDLDLSSPGGILR